MFNRQMLTTLAVFMMVFAASSLVGAQEHGEVHWGYEGEEGPDRWGELSEAWEACSLGSAQSPINLSNATPINLKDIEVNYGDTAVNIFNNGHTIQVNQDAGSSIVYNEIEYQLLQFHFHHPSEHTINGDPAEMEIHLVHVSENGNLAVIGVMLTASESANEIYAPLFDNLPTEESEPEALDDITLSAVDLLPTESTFYTYNGSLTTPPCTQVVRWLVMTEPVVLSGEQIEGFASIFEHNARPVQPLNDRDLFVDNE